jgi:peroxiredoxin
MTDDNLTPASRWSGALQRVVLPLSLLALIVGALWYWEAREDSASSGRYGPVELPAERNASGDDPAPHEGRPAPDFLLERSTGSELRLSDLQGQPVLLNFWASWCPPCREEMPAIVEQYERHKEGGLIVVGVNLQEPDAKIAEFAEDFGMKFPVVIDRTGAVGDSWRIGGAFEGLPSSYFIDADGIVRGVYNRPLTEESITEALALIHPGEAAKWRASEPRPELSGQYGLATWRSGSGACSPRASWPWR